MRPNVILILADDMGFADLGCLGSEIRTPNIDALATKGVKFWQAYSPAPVCSPSRAAILSGDHPARYMYNIGGGQPPGGDGQSQRDLPGADRDDPAHQPHRRGLRVVREVQPGLEERQLQRDR